MIIALILLAIALVALAIVVRRRARRAPGRPLDLPADQIVSFDSQAHPGKLLQARTVPGSACVTSCHPSVPR
jgi:hypothetical protein